LTEHLLSYLYILIFLIAFVILIRSLIEPHLLDVTTVTLPLNTREQTKLSSALKIILISDLHTEYLFIKPERVFNEIEKFQPDVILFTGDWCAGSNARALRKMEFWLSGLSGTAERLGIPLLAVPGNHDTPEIISRIHRSGCRLISDSDQIVTDRLGQSWRITGIAGLSSTLNVFSASRAGIPFDRHIVMAHNPDAVLSLQNDQGKFFLCGHFHGGQIWAPFKLEFRILRDEKMAAMGYHRGAFKINSHWCYINRGLGCVLMPFRFLSKPELTKLTLIADIDEIETQNQGGNF
jgi:predicted MPP superfamily phosphohydrolase